MLPRGSRPRADAREARACTLPRAATGGTAISSIWFRSRTGVVDDLFRWGDGHINPAFEGVPAEYYGKFDISPGGHATRFPAFRSAVAVTKRGTIV
jgi:hypothetical protein